MKKPAKVCCEICTENNLAVLHYHHIIPRTEHECTDDWTNVCIICSNCHNKVHGGQIKILGIFASTKLPYKRTLVYENNGVQNIPDIDPPYYIKLTKSMKVFTKEEK